MRAVLTEFRAELLARGTRWHDWRGDPATWATLVAGVPTVTS